MTQLNINPGATSFDQIYNQFKDHTSKKDDASLRLSGNNLHTKSKWPSGIGAKAAANRALKKEGAKEAVTQSIDRQLGKVGAGKEILKNLGLESRAQITVGDLKQINHAVKREEARAMRQARMGDDAATRGHHVDSILAKGLGALADSGKSWGPSISSTGASGVIFMAHEDNAQVCLKFQSDRDFEKADAFYGVLQDFEQMGKLPFTAPTYLKVPLATDSAERTKVDSRLREALRDLTAELGRTADPGERAKIQLKMDKIQSPGDKGYTGLLKATDSVAIYEKVPNANILSGLSTQQKVDAVRDGDFAHNLAKTSVIGSFMGLGDHLPMSAPEGVAPGGLVNLSNIMMDHNHQLHVIDIEFRQHPDLEEGRGRYGMQGKELQSQALYTLDSIFEATLSVEGLGEHVTDAINGGDSELCSLMTAAFTPQEEGHLFTEGEMGRTDLTGIDKQLFALHSMSGLLSGMEFLAANRDQIVNTFQESDQFTSHVGMGTAIDAIKAKLGSVDLEAVKATIALGVQRLEALQARM